MKLLVFSIFDDKASVFSNPFFMAHKGQALRAFSDLVVDAKSAISKHPSDYNLYCLGSFDDVSGMFKSLEKPEFLIHAVDCVVV